MEPAYNPVNEAIAVVGLTALARSCNVKNGTVTAWAQRGMPKTEWTKQTNYCKAIEKATAGRVTANALKLWTESLWQAA